MYRWQRTWRPFDWYIMLTVGRIFGFGFSGHAMKYNGVDIYFGPICLTVQPPTLRRLHEKFGSVELPSSGKVDD
jgi:hypothetical protein